MANQPVPDTMEVEAIFLLFGQRIENVYHVKSNTGVDAQVLSDCADAFNDWIVDSFMGVLSQDVHYLGLEVRNLDIPNGSVTTRQPGTDIHGAYTENSEPGGTTLCVSARTGQSGRSYRGRKYISGIPTTQRTGNTVLSSWAAACVAALNDLLTVLTAVNQVLVIVSRIQDHVTLSTPITTPVENFTVTDYDIDSQRRRLNGRGT